MKILVEIDLETNTSRIVSRDSLILDTLTSCICSYFGITKEELVLNTKEEKYYVPRQFYIYYSKTLFKSSYSKIARELHYKQHGTVISHWNKINLYLEQRDYKYLTHKYKIDELLKIIKT
jgi:chromosomal replication initiation ATPase DnaA